MALHLPIAPLKTYSGLEWVPRCKLSNYQPGARCSSVVRAFAHDAMGRRINPSWGEPIELFLVLVSAPRLV